MILTTFPKRDLDRESAIERARIPITASLAEGAMSEETLVHRNPRQGGSWSE